MSEIKNIKIKESWNKNDLTILLANEAGIPKVHAARYINIVTDTIAEALEEGKKVTISDFGTFQVSERRSFDGRNQGVLSVYQFVGFQSFALVRS